VPIKPENKARYPKNWKEIRESILERAGHRCEFCGVGNHWWVTRDGNQWICVGFNDNLAMVWPALPSAIRKKGASVTEIVLTIAHLDHTPENCDRKNLKALCQRCHLRYDINHHRQTAYATRKANTQTADLFE
jgi:hypothetical protein